MNANTKTSFEWLRNFAIAVMMLSSCQPYENFDETEEWEAEIIGGVISRCYPQTVRVDSGCTGTVIGRDSGGNDLVLTAAHCVVLGGVGGAPGSVNRGQRQVSGVYVHQEYNQCQPEGPYFAQTSGHDMAILRLQGSVLPEGILPAVWAITEPSVGAQLDLVGYGTPDRLRKVGRFQVESPGQAGALTMRGVNAGACAGDSGGPYYLSGACSGSPPPTVVAVESSQPLGGNPTSCQIGAPEMAASTANTSNNNFINSVLAGTATPWTASSMPSDCCTPGATRSCYSSNGWGSQSCANDGNWYPCVASGGGGGDDGGGGGDPGNNPGGGCSGTSYCVQYNGCCDGDGYLCSNDGCALYCSCYDEY